MKRQKSGLYRANISLPDKTRVYLSGKTIAELNQKKAEIKNNLMQGTYADDKGVTLRVWANKWLELYKTNKSYSTYHGYSNIIKNHLEPILDIRLKELKKSDIQLCINKQEGHYDIQRRIKLTLNQILEAAIDDGLLYRNVCKSVHVPVKRAEKRRALTQAERRVIPTLDLTPKERAFVYLLWYTGMRPEEVRALTINDIDFMRAEITVNKAAAFESNQAVLRPPKTDSGNRVIGILPPLREPLSDYINEVDSLYLFTQSDGSLMSRTSYRRMWNKIYDKLNEALGGNANFKATDITPYVFRHEYATVLYYSEVDVKDAARLMGHKDTRLILDVYAELDEGRSNSTEKIAKFLESSY